MDTPEEAYDLFLNLLAKSKEKKIEVECRDEYQNKVDSRKLKIRMTMIWTEIPGVVDCAKAAMEMPCGDINSSTFNAIEFQNKIDQTMGATLRQTRGKLTARMKKA